MSVIEQQRCAWTGFWVFLIRTPAASNRIRNEIFFPVAGSGLPVVSGWYRIRIGFGFKICKTGLNPDSSTPLSNSSVPTHNALGHNTFTLLRSESPSGKCAKLRTVAASNNRDHLTRSLYYCLFAPHVYIWVLFFAHIPFVVNHTFNATPPERLQRYLQRYGDRLRVLWVVRHFELMLQADEESSAGRLGQGQQVDVGRQGGFQGGPLKKEGPRFGPAWKVAYALIDQQMQKCGLKGRFQIYEKKWRWSRGFQITGLEDHERTNGRISCSRPYIMHWRKKGRNYLFLSVPTPARGEA